MKKRKADPGTKAPLRDVSTPPAAQLANGTASRDAWDDPTDTGRAGSYVRLVRGYRRADTLVGMHKRSPAEVTRQHLQAVERLRDDHEISQGVNTGGRGSGGMTVGPTEAMIDAAARFRAALAAVDVDLHSILLPITLAGTTVKDTAKRRGIRPEAARAELLVALDQLRDHYLPPVYRRR